MDQSNWLIIDAQKQKRNLRSTPYLINRNNKKVSTLLQRPHYSVTNYRDFTKTICGFGHPFTILNFSSILGLNSICIGLLEAKEISNSKTK
jgi:hypothetical protein